MSKLVQWLLLLLAFAFCIQISESRFINSYPTSTAAPFIPRAIVPRLPCPPDDPYRCCDRDDPSNNTCCLGLRRYNDSDECIANRNCNYFISYHYDNDTHYNYTDEYGINYYYVDNTTEYGWVNFTMQSQAGVGYTAYALSLDEKMGSDLVFVCELTEFYKVKMYLTWNYDKLNFRLNPKKIKQHKFLQVNQLKYEDNITTCVFGVAVNFSFIIKEPQYFEFRVERNDPFNEIFIPLLAGGKVVDGKLTNHQEMYITGFVNNKWAYTNFCHIEGDIPIYKDERVHASYMVVIFTLMIPMITFMTRFYKDYLPYRTPLVKKSLYYMMHVYFGTGSLWMYIASWALVSGTRSRKYLYPEQYPFNVHAIIGYVILCIFGFQFLVGLYRYKTPCLKLTRFLHASIGWTLHFFGVVGLTAAPFFTLNVLPCHFAAFPLIWLFAHAGFYRYLSNFMDKTHAELGHRYPEGRSLFMFPFPPSRRSIQEYPWKILIKRRKILIAFVSTSLTLTVIMLIYLSVDLDAPCYPAHKRKTRHMNNRRAFK